MASNEVPPITRRHDPSRRGFASDNYAGVHPAVLSALEAVNGGHEGSYGADAYSANLANVFRPHFGDRCEVFPVFNGTGANGGFSPANCGGSANFLSTGNLSSQDFRIGLRWTFVEMPSYTPAPEQPLVRKY